METDHEGLHQELESERGDMEERRDKLKGDTVEARQDVKSKVSDQRTPGLQDEQEDVIHGRDAVEEAQGDESEENGESGSDDHEGGGSEGAGYREDEE
jgi:hypothetical protein